MKSSNLVFAVCAGALSMTMTSGPVWAAAGWMAEQPVAADPSHLHRGKPRPPVKVRLVPGDTLASGVPGQLVLQVRSRMLLEGVSLSAEGDAGLSLVGPPRVASIAPGDSRALAAGEAVRFEISVTPTSGGTRYVSGLVTYQVNGVTQAAPFSLPIQVSGPVTAPAVARKPDRPPVRDANGELIDSMPAETTVR